MTTIIVIILIVVLLVILGVQISKTSQLIDVIKGDKEDEIGNNKQLALIFASLGIFLFIYVVVSAYKNYHKFLPVSASEQGVWIDQVMNITLILTGVVCLITNFLLFYFVYKFQYKKGRRAYYFPDDNKLELLWTIVPAIVLIVLVGYGLQKWFKVYSDAPSDAITIEATAEQFAWTIRYPGTDNQLGKRDFTLCNAENKLGVNWNDNKSHDDYIADEIVLPVNKPVLVKIGALDVIHNFYLAEFRMMLDAVPGVPTQFWFRPTITTEEMRVIKGDPEFDYMLACNQLCGTGHFNMKKTVKIVSVEEYKKWAAEQKSYYTTVVLPKLGEAKANENTQSNTAFKNVLSNGVSLAGASANGIEAKLVSFINDDTKQVDKTTWFSFDRLLFETGKSTLKPESKEQLNNMAEILKLYPAVELKIGGYTDNTGKAEDNLKLSSDRAKTVLTELVNRGIGESRLKAEGYGQEHPVADNATEEGRAQNRRIDVRVTKK